MIMHRSVVKPADSGVSTEARNHPPALGSLRILVVDDYPDAAETLAFLLRMDGHEVRTATDGPSALEVADVFRPEAIILDIGLPDMDGYQVATRLRETSAVRTARLVAMTGYAQYAFRARALAAGFDEFLVKPITLTTLREALTGNDERADPLA